MSDLDREVDRIIDSRQADWLVPGHDAKDSPWQPRQTAAVNGGISYEKNPGTVSPEARELPVESEKVKADLANPPVMSHDPAGVEPTNLDLSEALAYAMANSREYRNRQEQLYLAALDLLREQHLWGPRFFAEFSAQGRGTPDSGDQDHAMELIGQLQATQRLPYGGSVSATALVNFVEELRSQSGSTDTSQDSTITLSIVQPLLNGAGRVAQEGLIQSERDLIYAARSFERYRRTFLVDVSSRYFDLVRQQDSINNQKRQLSNLRWLAERTDALAEAGRQPFIEVQRAEQEVLFAQNELVSLNERYVSSLDSFKLLIGMPVSEALAIKPVEVVVPEPALEDENAVKSALTYRLDLQTSKNQIEDAARRVKVAANGRLPDLDLFADVSLRSDRDKDMGGADIDLDESSYSAGIRFSTELPRKTEAIAERQAQIQLERTRRSYAQQRDEVAQSVRESIRAIRQARFTLALQDKNIELAEKRLRGVVLQLRTLGGRDFIEAQERLLRARNSRDSAVRDLRVNILRYLLETGQMRVTADGQWQAPAKLKPIDAVAPLPGAEEMIQPEAIPAAPEN